MPQIAAAITAAATAFGATTAGSFLTTTILGKLLTSVALSALSLALAPRPRAPGIKTSQTQTGGTNPCQFILGRYATAGSAAAPAMSHGTAGKTPNAYLTYVLEVSDAPVTALDGLIIDGTKVTIGTTPHADYGLPILGDFTDRAWIRFHTGSQTTADPMLLARYADYPDRPWQADMIGRGLAYAILTFRYDREVYDSLPTVRFVVDGLKLYDPRKDTSVGGSGAQRWATPSTWGFTRNPIVMVYNILRGITLPDGHRWGGDCAAEDLPLGNWLAAMNLCDTEVTLAKGGTVPRYTAGFEVAVDDEPAAVIEELLKACHGQLVDMGGIWKVRAGGLGLPVYFFTDDDIIATRPEEFDPFPGLGETFNAISATYPEPASLWESREAPPRYNATWEAEDGHRRLVAALALPAVTHPRQVQHLMQAAIRDHRRMRRHNLTLTPAAAMLEPLDVISWTSARNGYVAKSFEVAEVAEDLRSCLPQIAIREVDPGDYDWQPADELPDPVTETGLVRPVAQAVPGFSAYGISLTDANGVARRPAIQLIWDGADLDDVEALEWELRCAGTTDLVAQGSTANVEAGRLRVAGGILPATAYQARARLVVRRKRAWTAWISATTPDTRAGTEDIAQAVFDQMEETARLAGVTPVSDLPPTGQPNQIVMLIPPGRLYRWDGTAWVTALYAGIEPGSLEIASFASSIRPVETLTSLPTSGNTVGRMVFLTTDSKIHRWNGTAWISTIPAADVTGQLVASQIADAAITTAKIAAGAVTASEIGSNAVTATKVSAGAITSDKLAANSVIAGKVAAGAISASQIAAGAVVASKLVVADLSNLVINNWTGGDLDGWSTDATNISVQDRTDTSLVSSGIAGKMVRIEGGDHWMRSPRASCSAGEKFHAEVWVRRFNAPQGSTLVQLRWTLNTGSAAYATIGSTSTNDSNIKIANTVTAPSNAIDVSLWIRFNLGGTSGAALLARPVLRRAASGELIVDGAITADKISAGAVTTNALAANAVVASKIAAGEITGTKLAATGIITATAQINNAVITGAKIASATIGTANIANAAITGAKIGNLEVDTINLAGNAVTVPQFAAATAGAVTMTLVLDQTAPVLLWGHVTNVVVNDASRQAQLKVNGTIVRRAYYAMDVSVSVFGPGTGYGASVFVSGASNLSLLHRISLGAGKHTIVVDAGAGDTTSTQCSVLALQVKK